MKIEEGKVVTLEFKVYEQTTGNLLEDTNEVGPFLYLHGFGNFVPKVEETLEGKEKGFTTTINLSIEEGYGEYDEELVMEMDRSEFAEFDDIYEGLEFVADMEDEETGEEYPQEFVITKIEDDVVVTDGNHPFAGKDLRFEVTVVNVREATDEEIQHGHAHFQGIEEEGLLN